MSSASAGYNSHSHHASGCFIHSQSNPEQDGWVESHLEPLVVFCVLYVGGNSNTNASNSANYGLSYANANNDTSNSNTNLGSRLSLIHGIITVVSTLPNGRTLESITPRLVAFNAKTWINDKGWAFMRNRLKDCYTAICSMVVLLKAADMACEPRIHTLEVAQFNQNRDELLAKLQDDLINHRIVLSPYHMYYKWERGKRRLIADLPLYPDRILHCAIAIVIEDRLNRTLIYQTHASIKGHGTHTAMMDVRRHLYNDQKIAYCLSVDVDQCYASIPPERVKLMLREYIKDNELLFLLDRIIDSYNATGYTGIALGGRLSPLFANLYLSPLDHYLKEELHVHILERYMDNYFIFGYSVKWLEYIRTEMVAYLAELGLTLNEGRQIYEIDSEHGVDMLGWVVYSDHVLIRKKTKEKMRRTFRAVERKLDRCQDLDEHDISSIGSYIGSLKWFDSYNLC